MAIRIGLIGPPNTGKSYSRKFIEKGEECMILAPSMKMMYLTESDGSAIKRLNIEVGGKGLKDFKDPEHVIVRNMVAATPAEYKVTGNWTLVQELSKLPIYMDFVDKCMPHINTIIIPDITHYISTELSDPAFITRKAGGEAFQRFWELAGETLRAVIMKTDKLRDDLIVVTEWHMEYKEPENLFEIFVPGGKMLTEKFKVDSYFDIMLYTIVENKEGEFAKPEDYKFLTHKFDALNARDAGLFEEHKIPNNLEVVLDRVREAHGLTKPKNKEE